MRLCPKYVYILRTPSGVIYIIPIIWLQARQSTILGEPIERWVRVGLQSMHEDHPLPEDLAALL